MVEYLCCQYIYIYTDIGVCEYTESCIYCEMSIYKHTMLAYTL